MNSDTTKQIIDALRPVADKIGQGASHLYEVYVRQAYITGIRSIVIGSLFLAMTVALGWVIAKWHKELDEGVIWVFMTGVVTLVVGFLLINSGVAHTFNPEYYGIKDIICQAKGGC